MASWVHSQQQCRTETVLSRDETQRVGPHHADNCASARGAKEDSQASRVLNKIRPWRKYRGLSQRQLADKIGVTLITVSRWERRERRLTLDQLLDIASALRCTMYDLLYRDPVEAPDLFAAWSRMSSERKALAARVLTSLVDPDHPSAG